MRLTADVWVSAYLTRLRLANIPAFIVQKGDATAGAVLVKVNTLNGWACCYQRRFDPMTGKRPWDVLAEGTETVVDNSINRQCGFDPDLWVVELEDRAGRHLLDQPGFSD